MYRLIPENLLSTESPAVGDHCKATAAILPSQVSELHSSTFQSDRHLHCIGSNVSEEIPGNAQIHLPRQLQLTWPEDNSVYATDIYSFKDINSLIQYSLDQLDFGPSQITEYCIWQSIHFDDVATPNRTYICHP